LKPRVIFLGPVPPPYMGPTLATEVILRSALAEEFELIHLDTSDHRDIDTLGAFDFTNIWLALKFYFMLAWMIVRHRPRMVYIPKDSGFILIAKFLGRRVLCHLRGGNFGNWLAGASGLTRLYVRLVHGMVNGQIVLGECLRPLFAGIVRPERLHVVPNGKDVDYQHRPASDGAVRFLFLANMVRSKGVMDVLHAVAPVTAACPDVVFQFAGSWEDPVLRGEIEEFLAAHPHLPIRWLGQVSGAAKRDALEQADAFVFPTWYPPEGHPWVVVEAMAAGLPVISCDQGAVRESVIDGVSGFIVRKQCPPEIAERSIQLARNPALRAQMGARGRELYRERFTEAAMVRQLSQAFHAVTDEA